MLESSAAGGNECRRLRKCGIKAGLKVNPGTNLV